MAALVEVLDLAGGGRVVEVGAGTGKLTRLIAPAAPRLVAVEPVGAMSAFVIAELPGVPVVAATAEALPLAAGCAGAVVVAQAFHWFRGEAALDDIHRVLRPGRRLGLIWNMWDDAVPWLAGVHAVIDSLAEGVPRYRTGQWRQAFERSTEFTPLATRSFPHAEDIDRTGMLDRVASTSFISALPEDARADVLDRVTAALAGQPERFTLPYRTDVHWCSAR